MSVAPYQSQTGGLVHMQQAVPARPSQVQELAEWAQAAQAAYQVSESLVQTSFVPEGFRNKPYEATAAILAGSEVGLSPMAALRAFDVIQGTAAPRAMTLRAIVQSQGHEVWVEETTDTRAVVAGRRAGSSRESRSVWTIDRARQLGLTSKHNWKAQPQAMLVARATSEVCRLIASDAILGLPYSSEEINDGGAPADLAESSAASAEAPKRTTRRRAQQAVKPAPAPDAGQEPEPTGPPLPSDEGYEEPVPADEPADKPTTAQNRKMHALFREAGFTADDRDKRLKLTGMIVGRDMSTSNGLSKDEASALIDQLEGWNADGHLADYVAAMLDDEQ